MTNHEAETGEISKQGELTGVKSVPHRFKRAVEGWVLWPPGSLPWPLCLVFLSGFMLPRPVQLSARVFTATIQRLAEGLNEVAGIGPERNLCFCFCPSSSDFVLSVVSLTQTFSTSRNPNVLLECGLNRMFSQAIPVLRLGKCLQLFQYFLCIYISFFLKRLLLMGACVVSRASTCRAKVCLWGSESKFMESSLSQLYVGAGDWIQTIRIMQPRRQS